MGVIRAGHGPGHGRPRSGPIIINWAPAGVWARKFLLNLGPGPILINRLGLGLGFGSAHELKKN